MKMKKFLIIWVFERLNLITSPKKIWFVDDQFFKLDFPYTKSVTNHPPDYKFTCNNDKEHQFVLFSNLINSLFDNLIHHISSQQLHITRSPRTLKILKINCFWKLIQIIMYVEMFTNPGRKSQIQRGLVIRIKIEN